MVDIISKLTTKDNKEACAYTQKIISESEKSNKWYSYFDEYISLLNHPKSLVRNRALTLIAANVKWDNENKFDAILKDYLSHITDEKPITSRECIKSLPKIGKAKPSLVPKILKELKNADLSMYKDSMRPLIKKDILEVVTILKN